MRLFSSILLGLLSVQATSAGAFDTWTNGPSKSASFFPIGVWWQGPLSPEGGIYTNQPAAAQAEKINVFIGISGSNGGFTPFPEHMGHDDGEFAALKAHNIYLISGIYTTFSDNNSLGSVANVQAAAAAAKASATLIGYNLGDEPSCGTSGGPALEQLPSAQQTLGSYDSTRPVFDNFLPWALMPQWSTACRPAEMRALAAVGIGSFDLYPITNPWLAAPLQTGGSDFTTVPNDTLFEQGLAVQAMIDDAPAGKPIWAYIESGSDNFGFSGAAGTMEASVAGTRLTRNYWWTRFTSTWLGLTVSGPGIPAGTTIVRVLDDSTAVLSAAVAPASNIQVNISGGGGAYNSNCVISANLCVVQGNAMRPTAEQVNAEVWMSIIAGARGIEYFCHDSTSSSFCLGGSNTSRNALARATQVNLTYVDSNVEALAPVLNSPTYGMCSLRRINSQSTTVGVGGTWTTSRSCTNRFLSLTTSDTSVPARAMIKGLNGITYLLVQSDQRSARGATFTFKIPNQGHKIATTIYDSNEHYRPAHQTLNQAVRLDGTGSFSDTLGAYGSDYQVKIYSISDGATMASKKPA